MPYKRVTICTVDQEYLGEFGTGGQGDGEFWWPSSLAFDSEDRLYVADEALHRISIFDRQGQFLGKWGTGGSEAGQFNRVSSIIFDSEDNLLVSDSLNHRIQKFTKDGRVLASWGGPGEGPGSSICPGVSAWTARETLRGRLAQRPNPKIQPDGKFLQRWGGSGDGEFNRPAALAVDPEQNLYVADWGNERVQVLNPEGKMLAQLRGDSIPSRWADDYFAANPAEYATRLAANLEPELKRELKSGREGRREKSASVEKLLWGPTSVKLDSSGRIYIVDSCRHRLQIYRRLVSAPA